MSVKINKVNLGFEREPLMAAFGFKGGYVNELWQTATLLQDENGNEGLGLGTQSVLWSDSTLFSKYSPSGGNSIMLLLTEYALNLLHGQSMRTPLALTGALIDEVYKYGKHISGMANLRKTFALNALTPVDMALWQLYAAEKGIATFDELIPQSVAPYLKGKQKQLAAVPLITYGMPAVAISSLVNSGSFFLKIKLGCDPDGDRDPEKMLLWDMNRLSTIHDMLKNTTTPYTESGKIPYYLDANGRYDCKERLIRLVDHLDKIGALENVILLEEPFPEEAGIDVSDIPVRIVADESVHSEHDVDALVELGYRGIALKPIAKTLSMSFRILEHAAEKGIPCFCADLTVNPLMVDWNKNLAARLDCLPGMRIGVMESNGKQNYTDWAQMLSYHPMSRQSWLEPHNGVFGLNRDFYQESGGIFAPAPHYRNLALGR